MVLKLKPKERNKSNITKKAQTPDTFNQLFGPKNDVITLKYDNSNINILIVLSINSFI